MPDKSQWKKSDFTYELPPELIAQTPLALRDHSRLLYINRATGALEHRRFYEVLDYLHAGDCLVLNDTRVLPARLLGVKEGGGAACEVLLLKDLGKNRWECIVHPGRRLKEGARIDFGSELSCEVKAVLESGNRIIEFFYEGIFIEILERVGLIPLPHYIHEEIEDPERYQTVYSQVNGSAAAPTAGLHFTPELLAQCEAKGVEIARVTLHVGLGTFRPVKAENITDHIMHSEQYFVDQQAADTINRTKSRGGKVVGVGTTSARTLETASDARGVVAPQSGSTDIFIYPGYRFKCMDGLITNFHLPESTLIMLVSAFSSREIILNAYQKAVEERYRFFSFGDACIII